MSIAFPYDTSEHKNPNSLEAFLYDESVGDWVTVPLVSVDDQNGLVTVNINHFSSLALTAVDVEKETRSNLEIKGGFGCGAIKNIHRNGGNSPPWPLDLFLLGAMMLWLGLKKAKHENMRISF